MNRKFSLFMLTLIVAQYLVPVTYTASEIASYVADNASEITSEEVASEEQSEEVASEEQSELTSEEQLELASEERSELTSEEQSEEVASEEQSDEVASEDSDYQEIDDHKLNIVNGSVIPGYYKDDVITYEQVITDMGFEITSQDGLEIQYPDGTIDTSVAGNNFQTKVTIVEVGGETKDITLKYNVYNGAIPPSVDYGYADKGDAPLSYGNPTIYTDKGSLGDVSGDPEGFYLGMDAAFFDETDDNDATTFDGMYDDMNSGDGEAVSFDDETGFLYTYQNSDGIVDFDVTGGKIYLTVPYANTNALEGQISLWFDFDGSGTFDADEAFSQTIEPTGDLSRTFGAGNEAFEHHAATFEIDVPDDVVLGDSYMRAVLTTNTGDISGQGNHFDLSEGKYIGEIEDYAINFNKDSLDNVCLAALPETPNLVWDSVEYGNAREPNSVVGVPNGYDSIKYIGIPGPFGQDIDLEITLTDRDYPDDSIALLTDATEYPIDPDGLIYAVFNDNRGDSVHVQMNTYLTGTDTSIEVPLQIRIYGLRSKGTGRDSDNVEILNIEPDPLDIWFEQDNILDHDVDNIWPTGQTDGQAYEGSLAIASYVDDYASTHEFDMDIDYHGGIGVSIGWPTVATDLECKVPEADLEVDKAVTNESGVEDGIVENGEEIEYTITINNLSEDTPATDVLVRDDLLENLPSWITVNGEVSVSPTTTVTTGDLTTGDFTISEISGGSSVTITYTLKIDSIPSDVEEIGNLVTLGDLDPSTVDPEVCIEEGDCAQVVMPPETTIEKTAVDFGEDGTVSAGEMVTYTITVTNQSNVDATNVPVRDSLFEQISSGAITYASLAGGPSVAPALMTSGDLGLGTYKIDSLPAGSSVGITYQIILDEIPTDTSTLLNIATDNGIDPLDPSVVDPEVPGVCINDDDCALVELPIIGSTNISKTVVSESVATDGVAEQGEEITYQIEVSNPTGSDANNVVVRDNVLESIATIDWLDLKADSIVVNPETITYSGDLTAGNFKLDTVPAGETVTIQYTLVVGEYPDTETEIENWATDNGLNPDTCTEADDEDCTEEVIDLNPSTEIEKALIGESFDKNGIVEDDEDLTYALTITNKSDLDALNVAVRDSLLEELPTFVTWDGTFDIDPDTITYSGDLTLGTFKLDSVPANSSVTITYTLSVGTIPDDVKAFGNIATNDGKDPIFPCLPTDDTCSIVIHPTEPETVITKSVTDGDDNIAQVGDVLTYTIEVDNLTNVDAPNTFVRDSLVEGIVNGDFPYLTYNADMTITDGTNTLVITDDYLGDLTTADLEILDIPAHSSVYITYSVTVNEIPADVADIENIATDDGGEPTECTEISTDCTGTITPVDPGTSIVKSTNLAADQAVSVGDQITYTITVQNLSDVLAATSVNVQDSLLENFPSYLSLDSISIDPEDTSFSGVLEEGNITIAEIPAGEAVTIAYTVTVKRIPNDVESIINIATDNGIDPLDPSIVDPEVPGVCLDEEDCTSTITPVDPETVITKSATDTDGNNIVEEGETIFYTIDVTNPGANTALDVVVRDSLVEEMTGLSGLLSDLTFNNDVILTNGGITLVNPDDYTGSLTSGDLTIKEIAAGESVSITFSVTVDSIDGLDQVTNIATDDGSNPGEIEICLPFSKDCDSVTVPTNPETTVTKESSDAGLDGKVSVGEEINYTITVSNPSDVDALNVVVKDNLLADMPDYLSLVGTPVVTPSATVTTGDLTSTDGLTIASVPAGESVTIEYTLVLNSNPTDDALSLINLVTDNGIDPIDPSIVDPEIPELCIDENDCGSTIDPIDADTVITKAVTSESGDLDGVAEEGELLEYTITVTNPTEAATAYDVVVRDSLLPNLPSWLTEEGDIVITPADADYSGHLANAGGMTISEIAPGQNVTISYSLRVGTIPNDVTSVINLATDNGDDPTTVDPDVDPEVDPDGYCEEDVDCGQTVTPIQPETIISKTATDSDTDGKVSVGEEVMYEITITNPSSVDATAVQVIDSLYSNLPSYMSITTPFTVADDILLSDVGVTGDLADAAGITIDNIPAGKTVTITYGLTLNTVPADGVASILNIVTDNGEDPSVIDPDTGLPITECPEGSEGDCDSTLTPIDADTQINKAVTNESGVNAGEVESGETVEYTLTVSNITDATAYNVAVRDSLIEAITNGTIDYATFDGITSISPTDIITSGSLTDGSFEITEVPAKTDVVITYTVTFGDIPTDVAEVGNLVTDNGEDPTTVDPETCLETPGDCIEVVLPTRPDTIIEKSAITEDGDNIVSEGETITYTVTVENPGVTAANDVNVRDSLLENLPDYVTFNDDVKLVIDGTELILDTDYTGDLTTTDGINIGSIPAGKTVTITYSVTLDDVPADGVVALDNVVTDDGQDPSIVLPEICLPTDDCDEVVTPVDPDTTIEKSLVNESITNDLMAEDGEDLTYTLTVRNDTDANALNVAVRDNLLEALATTEWLSLVGDITIEALPTYTVETTGDLQTGDFVITEVPANTVVTITYTIHVDVIPRDVAEIGNIATDNGQDPNIVDPEVCVEEGDCSEIVVPTNPQTSIEKSLLSESIETNGIAQAGETLTFRLAITNDDATLTAKDIAVRDSMVEAIANGDITYLTYDGIVSVTPTDLVYTGDLDLAPSQLVISEIAPDETVYIDYAVTVSEIPSDVLALDNIATDNGQDPSIVDPEVCVEEGDCSEVITPTNPDTIIEKSVVDGNTDGLAQTGEVLTFTLKVSNVSDQDTASVQVRDSLVEGITNGDYPYLTFNDDAEITGVTYSATSTGSLTDGSYEINSIPAGNYAEITYSVTVDSVPTDIADVLNIATDNGTDPNTLTPELCAEDLTNCDSTVTPVDPETVVTKTVTDGDDEVVQPGDELTYTITVTNPSTEATSSNVVVRDSIIENLPEYMTFVSEVVTPDTLVTTGSLLTSGITIEELPANSSATITVKVTVDEIPNDVESILNIVTDNGVDPTDPSIVDPEHPDVCLDEDDCDSAIIPVDPETTVTKSVASETGVEAGIIENGETITYQLDVTNPGANTALDVLVRDSMIENLPAYATYNADMTLSIGTTDLILGTDYTGDLSTSDLVINQIAAGATVTITYSVTFGTIPNDVAEIGNLVTDDGQDPSIVDPEVCPDSDDCDEITVPVNPETVVTKTATTTDGDAVLSEGETVFYTIEVTNPSVVDAEDVQVIDSLLSNIPDYMTFNDDVVLSDGSTELELDTDYTGDLTTADGIVINTITAGSTITITYSLTLDDVPATGVVDVANVVTDDGQDPSIVDPEVCVEEGDCSEVVTPVDPDTTITKAVTNESIVNDNQAQQGEEITYTITVTNPTEAEAVNVEVKDSILANMPDYLSLVGAITIDPTTTETTGDLTTDDFVITSIPANSSVTITYTLLVGDVPSDLEEILNIATDNGIDPLDPSIVDPEVPGVCINDEDCAIVVVPTNPETEVEKALTGESVDVNGIAEPGETLTYEIRVTNNNEALSALDIPVRDSLIEEITNGDYPDYTYNGITSTTPDPLATKGDLTTGDFTIDSIAPDSTVVIEYTVTLANPITQTDKFIGNIVTDNGDDPVGICPPTSSDCSQVIVPKEPDTIITKSVTDSGSDGIANQGDILTYTVTLENPTLVDAPNVTVRDSLLEDMPAYLELVEDSFTVDPSDTVVTGDMLTGFTVDNVPASSTITFTYQVKVLDVPDTEETVTNIVTDDTQDPTECTEISSDCSGTITPLEPETVIEKTVTDANGDGAIQTGEELTYEITVSNTHDSLTANNVVVRDSMLENLPDYVTLVSTEVAPAGTETTGDLTNGDFTISEVEPDSSVVITVVVTVDQIPTDIETVLNIVTDNGVDPIDPSIVDPEVPGVCLDEEDCGIAVLPVDPETTIEKALIDESIGVDGIAEEGETLTYQISVTNPGANTALDVEVRDSLVEAIANGDIDWLTFNDDVVTDPTDLVVSGSLTDGTYQIDEVEANATVTLTYTITVGTLPSDAEAITNIVTDNGIDPIDPSIVDPEVPGVCINEDDCGIVVVPTNPETEISKSVTDGDDDIAQIGDELTYTITVSNTSDVTALDVVVRDSILENMPSYLELVSIDYAPDTTSTTGDLANGDFTISEIPVDSDYTITYVVKVVDIPTDVVDVLNIATDNGIDPLDPSIVDPEVPGVCLDEDDCASTITPVDPETTVTKAITNQTGSDDARFEDGETVTYALTVTNPGANTALDVVVRDSLVEAIANGDYSYLTVSNITIDPATTVTTGGLDSGDFTISEIETGESVTITYDVTAGHIPSDVAEIGNIVTDNGIDPIDPNIVDPEVPGVCIDLDDCGIIVTPVEPETTIEKTVSGESIDEDGIAEVGETISYDLTVTNMSDVATAHDVIVRDSIVEAIEAGTIDYLSYDGYTIDPDTLVTTGTIEGGDFTISEIEAGASITVTINVTVLELPEGISNVVNIATDNGQDPTDPELICPPASEDCSTVVTPLNPATVISKSVSDATDNGAVETGEVLTYTINVANPSSYNAVNIAVRDSLVEGITNGDYPYLTFGDDVTITGNTFDATAKGDLTVGSYSVNSIPAGMNVDITYTVTVDQIPTDVADVLNIATDNGIDPLDPSIVDPEVPGVCLDEDDCASTITPVDPETTIEKSVTVSGDDDIASTGDTLTYAIDVTNTNESATALDVVVRDSMLETLEADYPYLTFVSEAVTPGTVETSGSLLDSGITIAELEAGQTATITVVLTINEIPDGVTEILNIATDNGQDPSIVDPEVCVDSDDCSEVTEPVDADTTIEKSIIAESDEVDGYGDEGEEITYQLAVTNNNDAASAYDVIVRDSMYENMPSELELISTFTVNPTSIEYTGDLADGDLTLVEIPAGETVYITYTIKVNVVNGANSFTNITTDTGVDPLDPSVVDPENPDVCINEDDCGLVVLPIKPNTRIHKEIIEESIYDDNVIEDYETVTYRLTIENYTSVDSIDTPIQDSVLQELDDYDWLTLGDVTVGPEGTVYSGDLTDGSFVIDVPANSSVTIDYELLAAEVPNGQKIFENIVTDDGTDPALCSPIVAALNEDCSIHFSLLEADTMVQKHAQDENLNGVIEDHETVRYVIDVTNSTNIAALDTVVRDSMLEDLPSYVTIEDFKIFDSNRNLFEEGVDYSGSMETGDLTIFRIPRHDTVRIEYHLTFDVIPDDVTEISNLVTTDGLDPELCTDDDPDCSEVISPVEGDTTIDKAITSEDGEIDGVLEDGETLTYQVTVENSSENKAVFVEVRDSMLENMPEYATLVSDIEIDPVTAATGDLQSGDYVITEMEAGDVVTITYSVQFNDIPSDVLDALNIVTDDGQDPTTDVCPITMKSSKSVINDDCAYAIIPTEGDTSIEKALVDESIETNNLAELGEDLTYELTITNETDKDAHNVAVRDNLLENTPSFLEVGEITINSDTGYSGDLTEGTFVLDEVPANSSVTITYVLHVSSLPDDVATLENIATDNGQDPDTVDPEICAPIGDCSEVVNPVEGDTTVEKNVLSTTEIYSAGDTIEYQLVVSNNTVASAHDVPVRDSLLEASPEYLSYNNDLKVDGAKATGDMTNGTFVLDEVAANSKVYITYSMELSDVPTDESLVNIVTDNGENPTEVEKKTDDNEDFVESPLDPTVPMTDGNIIHTGFKTTMIIIDLSLILLVAAILKKRLA